MFLAVMGYHTHSTNLQNMQGQSHRLLDLDVFLITTHESDHNFFSIWGHVEQYWFVRVMLNSHLDVELATKARGLLAAKIVILVRSGR